MVIIQADVQKNSFLARVRHRRPGKNCGARARNDVPTFGTPAVVPYTAGGAKAQQVVVNGWNHIGGYDFKTGKELWMLKGGGDIPVPTPVFDGRPDRYYQRARPRPSDLCDQDRCERRYHRIERRALPGRLERAGNYMQTPLLDDGLGIFLFRQRRRDGFSTNTGEKIVSATARRRSGGRVDGIHQFACRYQGSAVRYQ